VLVAADNRVNRLSLPLHTGRQERDQGENSGGSSRTDDEFHGSAPFVVREARPSDGRNSASGWVAHDPSGIGRRSWLRPEAQSEGAV
jgi:hypothetical protein